MRNSMLCVLVLTTIIISKCKCASEDTGKFSIGYNGAPEDANLEILHRLKTLEKLREDDVKESILMRKTMDSYHSVLGKALEDITSLKQEFGKLQQKNSRLHSKLESVMLQNVALSTQCKKRCSSAEIPSYFSEPTNTFSQEKTSYHRNLTETYPSEPAQPTRRVTQDTVDSKRKLTIRRSPMPFPRTRRVAEGVHGSGFFARSSNIVQAVAIGHTIIFDSVITNTHNDYNGFTGAFTCSSPGLYVFTWTIQINIHFLKSQLLKNGADVADGYAGDDVRYWTTGTSTAVLNLVQGDVVVVHVLDRPGAIDVLPHVTSFSGFLVE